MAVTPFSCPCCGFRALSEEPGSYDVCRVCGWEDDPLQYEQPFLEGGANEPSLHDARQNYLEFGAAEARVLRPVPEIVQESLVESTCGGVVETGGMLTLDFRTPGLPPRWLDIAAPVVVAKLARPGMGTPLREMNILTEPDLVTDRTALAATLQLLSFGIRYSDDIQVVVRAWECESRTSPIVVLRDKDGALWSCSFDF